MWGTLNPPPNTLQVDVYHWQCTNGRILLEPCPNNLRLLFNGALSIVCLVQSHTKQIFLSVHIFVILIRITLLFVGKIAAQCGHAAVGCYKRSRRQCPSALSAWERTGCAKIAVKCPSEEEMGEIFEKAAMKGIPLYLVEDAGRTQIAAGSRTVLGLGPAPVREFEGVTSHLKLM